jgi:hypothetical protein
VPIDFGRTFSHPVRVMGVPQGADPPGVHHGQQFRNHRRGREGVVSLDSDGDTESFREGNHSLEDPCRRLDLIQARSWVFGQRAALNAYQRRFPVVGEFEEPAEFGLSVVGGEKDHAVDDCHR